MNQTNILEEGFFSKIFKSFGRDKGKKLKKLHTKFKKDKAKLIKKSGINQKIDNLNKAAFDFEKSFEKVYGHKTGNIPVNLSIEDFIEKELLDDPKI